jgi:hypothetical protein
MSSELTRCEACCLPLSDDPELWHSIHPRVDLPDATEANEWAQDHQGDYHEKCCPLCKKKSDQ